MSKCLQILYKKITPKERFLKNRMEKIKNFLDKEYLYNLINSVFSVLVISSNVISAKMVKVPFLDDFSIPAGLITYPLTFFITDFITEIYGPKKAKETVYHALCMSIIAYIIIKIALILPSATPDNQHYFEKIMGLNGMLLAGSLTAYIFSQILDIQIYSLLKNWTGERFLWLRNNGAALIGQLADTAIVNLVYLKVGAGMDMQQVFPIMIFSYLYKCSFNLVFTPLFYFLIFMCKRKSLMPITRNNF